MTTGTEKEEGRKKQITNEECKEKAWIKGKDAMIWDVVGNKHRLLFLFIHIFIYSNVVCMIFMCNNRALTPFYMGKVGLFYTQEFYCHTFTLSGVTSSSWRLMLNFTWILLYCSLLVLLFCYFLAFAIILSQKVLKMKRKIKLI